MKQILYLLLNIPLFVTTTRESSRVGFMYKTTLGKNQKGSLRCRKYSTPLEAITL